MNHFATKLADGARLDLDGLVVRLRISRRARRVSLRIDPARRELIAIAPTAHRLVDAWAFARERRAWATARLATLPPSETATALSEVILFGQTHQLVADGRRPRVVAADAHGAARLVGCGPGSVDITLLTRGIRAWARDVFAARTAVHCAALGVAPPRLSVADARTRWGSCSPARGRRAASIRLSWRLALAPFAVADYVVAHECAHLREANHGPRFWALVNGLVGDPKPHRAWLRANGARLHAFGADAEPDPDPDAVPRRAPTSGLP